MPRGILDAGRPTREAAAAFFVRDGHFLLFVSLLDVDDGTARAGDGMRGGACAPLRA